MNVNFYLFGSGKKNKIKINNKASKRITNDYHSIYLVCRHKGELLRWNTGIRVTEMQWDKKKMRVRNHKQQNLLNGKLAELAEVARSYESSLPLSVKPTQDTFNNHFWIQLKLKDESNAFFVVVDDVLENLPQRQNRNHEIIGNKTIGKYKIVANALRMYEEEKKKNNNSFRLNFKTFNEKLLREFESFLCEGKYKENTKPGIKPNARNTVVRQMEILFAFFTAAQKKGIEVCQDYKDYDNSKEKVVNVTITKEEFEQIYSYRSGSERLENVRKLFVIACTTGFRYSDISNLTMDNINVKEGVIQKIQQKTNSSVNVALHPLLYKMLQETHWKLPTSICNQDFNRYLKELFQEIGLDRTIQISRIVGKKRLVTDYKLYEIASSKMGRRYLCSSLAGIVPDRTIMAMSGHRSVSAFHSYLCNTCEQEREAVGKVWESQYADMLQEDLDFEKLNQVQQLIDEHEIEFRSM